MLGPLVGHVPYISFSNSLVKSLFKSCEYFYTISKPFTVYGLFYFRNYISIVGFVVMNASGILEFRTGDLINYKNNHVEGDTKVYINSINSHLQNIVIYSQDSDIFNIREVQATSTSRTRTGRKILITLSSSGVLNPHILTK